MLRNTASSLLHNCIRCGARVASNALFCVACGAPVDAESTRTMVRTESATDPRGEPLNEAERIVFVQRPTQFFVVLAYCVAVLGAILLTALSAYVGLPAFVSLLLALPLLLVAAFRHLKRNAVCYTLTNSKIEIAQGVLMRTTRSIPLSSIQNVTVMTTILQRLLGFGDLVIDDASAGGGTTVLRNLPDTRRHAESLLRELRR